MKCLELLPLYFQLGFGEITFASQQLKTRVKLGDVLTRLLRFLTKDVDVMINTLLRFEVVGQRFDGSFVFIVLFGRFWYGQSFEHIAGFLSNIMQ